MTRPNPTHPSLETSFFAKKIGKFDSAAGKLLSERFFSMAIVLRQIPVIGLPLFCTFKLCGFLFKQMENLSGTTQKNDLKKEMQGYDLSLQDK